MKILISISHLEIGGAQTFVARLAKGLLPNHSVYIYDYKFFPNYYNPTVINQLPPNIKLIFLPQILDMLLIKLDKICSAKGFQPRIRKLIKRLHFKAIVALYKIDIINTHLYHSDSFVTTTMQNSKIPIVMSDHGDYRYVVERGISTLGEVLKIFNRLDGIVYLSSSNAKVISKYAANSMAVKNKIYNGIFHHTQKNCSDSSREKLRIPENAFVFGMVARGIPEKGWIEAIQAFELLQSLTDKNMHLILVGDSDYLSYLRQSLDTKLSSFVHFTGYSSEPNYWIECFDVGLLPTYFSGESLPNSIIEYLSLHKPVIATELGGISEMITYEDQQAGILLRLNEEGRIDIHSLVNAMLKYITNPALLKQHSQLAKQTFENFKIENCVEKYERMFSQVLEENSGHLKNKCLKRLTF